MVSVPGTIKRRKTGFTAMTRSGSQRSMKNQFGYVGAETNGLTGVMSNRLHTAARTAKEKYGISRRAYRFMLTGRSQIRHAGCSDGRASFSI